MHAALLRLFWAIAGGSFGRVYLRRRKELERRMTLDREGMERRQWWALRRIVDHAYTHVPLYRQRFDEAGLHPEQIRSPEDFRRVPILTRQDLQQHLELLVASDFERRHLRRNQTGGSTGNPVVFYDYEENQALQKAMVLRSRSWAGFTEGDKIAILWGADRDIPTWSRLERLKIHGLFRQRWLNSYHLTPEKMERFAEQLIDWKPRYILGYAASVYLFAQFLRERGVDRIRPVAIETSAEKLWDYQRELIEDVFHCKVFDAYGSRDVANIAFECEAHDGLHVLSDNVYLELLADGVPAEPGEIGEIVVTKLTNFAMPLIRYRNGDLARTADHECSCGRPFPLLAEIVGRSNDVITTPRGELIHGAFFNHLFFGVPGVRQFQVRQPCLEHLDVDLCSGRELPAQERQELHDKVVAQLGPGVSVAIRQVEAIEPTPTGKHRYIISDVGPRFATRSD